MTPPLLPRPRVTLMVRAPRKPTSDALRRLLDSGRLYFRLAQLLHKEKP